jgi:hypothetical protein
MAVGLPLKTTYANGDVYSSSDVNDTNGTINAYVTTSPASGVNKIINGDFFVNQRNFTSVTSSGTYTFDRWYTDFLGGTCTYTPQTFTAGTAPVSGYNGNTFIQIAISGQSGSNYASYNTRIEDVRTLAGQTATISFWARVTSGTPVIYTTLTQRFGTGGSPSSAIVTTNASQTLSTTWTRYSVTVSVPSISGKTIGTTANTSSLELDFMLSVGGVTAINNNTFQIWGVQVQQGSTATAFQTATGTVQGELAACQRYFYNHISNGSLNTFGIGYYYSSTEVQSVISFPVTMRTAPTLVASSGSAYYSFERNNGSDAIDSWTIQRPSVSCSNIKNTTDASGTAGQAGTLEVRNTSASISFSAEL